MTNCITKEKFPFIRLLYKNKVIIKTYLMVSVPTSLNAHSFKRWTVWHDIFMTCLPFYLEKLTTIKINCFCAFIIKKLTEFIELEDFVILYNFLKHYSVGTLSVLQYIYNLRSNFILLFIFSCFFLMRQREQTEMIFTIKTMSVV